MLTKYYVESGSHFKFVVLATDEIDAILRAVTMKYEETESLQLADLMIVNERGFVWDRPGHELYGDEFALPTRVVLGSPEEEVK
ncbi:MAG TPA: hypothetical protein VL096_14810 [Pirellulaceae bacterium]|nr:hypothetical protein [Pirellulaceae bacterium]